MDSRASTSVNGKKNYEVTVEVEVNETEEQILNALQETEKVVENDKNLKVMEAIKLYPKEIFWSCVFCIGVVMCGYDAAIITSFYALPAFQKAFGEQDANGKYFILAPWQTALGMGSPIGQVIGTLGITYPLELFGRKWTYMVICLASVGLVFMQFFAPSLAVLTAGEILAGILWGSMVLIGPTYASEVSHIRLRGILTAMNNMAFVIGQFIASGMSQAFATNSTKWAYKIQFAVQWVWPLLIIAMLPFAPESPYWLVRKSRFEDARRSLKSLSSANTSPIEIEDRLNVIAQTDSLERQLEKTTSYFDLFKGTNFIRTEICCMVYSIQVFCGVPFATGYSTYFFELAGISTSVAFDLTLGSSAIGFVGTCCCWVLLSYCGRRRFYNFGLAITTGLLFVIGFLDLPSNYTAKPGLAWTQATMMLIWSFIYQVSTGPLCFVYIGEIPSTILKSKTIAFSTAMQACWYIVATIALPYMLIPNEGNMRGKTSFVFGGMSLLCMVWSYFRLPETEGRSFEELDILFHKKVSPRKFKKTLLFESEKVEEDDTQV